MKSRFSILSLAIVVLLLALVCAPLALRYRAQVMLPNWIASKGGYVNRVHDKIYPITLKQELSLSRTEQLPDGKIRRVTEAAHILVEQIHAQRKPSGTENWSVFSGSDWDISHVALPISELDDATIGLLDSIESIKSVTVTGMQDITPPNTSYGLSEPDPQELERLRVICQTFTSCEVFCEFKNRLKKDYIVFHSDKEKAVRTAPPGNR